MPHPLFLRKIWWWLLDEWCAASVKSFAGAFSIEHRDGLPYVFPKAN